MSYEVCYKGKNFPFTCRFCDLVDSMTKILSKREFDQIFISPQVKRSVIISNKNGIYDLPHDMLNYLRLMILGN